MIKVYDLGKREDNTLNGILELDFENGVAKYTAKFKDDSFSGEYKFLYDREYSQEWSWEFFDIKEGFMPKGMLQYIIWIIDEIEDFFNEGSEVEEYEKYLM